ncbi:DMT family transporter [Teichococcus aestuarii]|uniref:DMT family transporter n=1 Tax=Teichococcus aestuarii TaxID=568898 RepID=UPI003608C21F
MPLRHDVRRGALMMLGATALFTVMGALVKALGDRIPFPELMFFRNALALPVVLLIGLRRHVTLRTRRFPGHVARALTGTAAMSCSFFSLTVLPLAEQTALTYSTPLFVTILSIPFLGERPGIHRWGAVIAGFVGILIIAIGQGPSARRMWCRRACRNGSSGPASPPPPCTGCSPASPPCWCASSPAPRAAPPSCCGSRC